MAVMKYRYSVSVCKSGGVKEAANNECDHEMIHSEALSEHHPYVNYVNM